MHACLWALAALAVCALLLQVARRKQLRPVFAHIPPVPCAVLVAVMVVCTLFSSKNTNSPPAGIMSPFLPGLTGGTPVAPVVVTPEDIARGHRLESVTTNDAVSYAMPTNGVEYAPWSLGGGYETHFPLDLGDFTFPFGTGVVHRLDVLSGGMVESLPRQRVDGACYSSMMSICAAREYASIVPGVGRFWWADAAGTAGLEAPPYRMKLLTWENVYGERDRTGQYSAQIELWDDGNFTTRSNNVESVYRRVLPFDLDNDGLPNDIDPAPESPIVPSARNQSEVWATAAFPSNAAEIAAMGGYAAWVAARGAEPDRRLVTLGVSFDDGSAWPTLLDFGGVPVVADGGAELSFPIDCGAKVSFSLTSGRLGSVTVTATEPPMRSGEGLSTTESSEIQSMSDYPHERMVGDVKLHLEDPRSGWLCHIAGVSVEPSWLPHFFPGDSIGLTATVSDCHSNAYLGCTWHGGEGIQFSAPNSLSTTVTYDSASTVEWATNGIDLITQFVGYSLTNHVHFTVGTTNVPPLRFSLGCQDVYFLNDADFLDGACPSNRPERIRPVTLNLTGPVGTNGTVTLSVEGDANPVVFHVVNGTTNLVTASTEIPLAVTNGVSYTGSYTIYVSCPNLGTGTITATFTPSGDNVEPLTAYATFRCIEPLRKLVTTEKFAGRYVNPSRLVTGTNAVLKVGANGSFSPLEVDWRLISGSAEVEPRGWYAIVTPTGMGTVVVEARFNDDEIQPRFVLPVVQPRTIPVRVFVVQPPESVDQDVTTDANHVNIAWDNQEIYKMLDTANEIFMQVGVSFDLANTIENIAVTNAWRIPYGHQVRDAQGRRAWQHSQQLLSLVANYTAHDCLKLYFVGEIISARMRVKAMHTPFGIVVGRRVTRNTLAHEMGHALGLDDCYAFSALKNGGFVYLPYALECVDAATFLHEPGDWGEESGRGFYEMSDTRMSVLMRMLMHGISVRPDSRCDIPADYVMSLKRDATTQQHVFRRVGERAIQPENQEVYSR